jgi:hypothetical protein
MGRTAGDDPDPWTRVASRTSLRRSGLVVWRRQPAVATASALVSAAIEVCIAGGSSLDDLRQPLRERLADGRPCATGDAKGRRPNGGEEAATQSLAVSRRQSRCAGQRRNAG